MRDDCAARLSVAPHIRNFGKIWSLTLHSKTSVGGGSPTGGEAIQDRFDQAGPVKKLNDRFANEMIGDQYNPNTIVAQANTPIRP